jgi:hypothetical protein
MSQSMLWLSSRLLLSITKTLLTQVSTMQAVVWELTQAVEMINVREHGIILQPNCFKDALYASQFSYARPIFSTKRLSISILFLMSSVYFPRSSLSSSFSLAGTTSLEARDVFSRLPSYKHEMGTKLPDALHNHPWAALSAAPSEAESGQDAGLI